MSKKDVTDKVPIYKLKTTEDIMKHYDKWGDKYDKDMVEWNYTGPQETVNIFKKHTLSKDIKIFDAGCGTGRVGIELKKFGYTNIDGADLSKKLLDLVPKGFYNKLEQIDLNKSLNKKSNIYDAVLCVGTFTFGHVKPPALDELIKIIKNKGLICFTVNEGIYEEYGFDKKIKELSDKKAWDIKVFFKSDYIVSKDVNAWLCLATIVK
jgi:predicted TPR repeat methyltransferase